MTIAYDSLSWRIGRSIMQDWILTRRTGPDPLKGVRIKTHPNREKISSQSLSRKVNFIPALVADPSELYRLLCQDTFTPEQLIEAVGRAYGFSTDQMVARHRIPQLVEARWQAMWLLRERLNLSYPKIGKLFGGMDHTTVMHACRQWIKRGKVA